MSYVYFLRCRSFAHYKMHYLEKTLCSHRRYFKLSLAMINNKDLIILDLGRIRVWVSLEMNSPEFDCPLPCYLSNEYHFRQSYQRKHQKRASEQWRASEYRLHGRFFCTTGKGNNL